MLRNNLLIAFRQLIKQPLFSFIKISGLMVGVTGCLVIFLMASHELGFEKFQTDRDRVYRIYSEFSGVYSGINRGVPEALPGTVSLEFTGIDAVAHLHTMSLRAEVEQNGELKKFDEEKNVLLAGPEFFQVFTFHQWLAGSAESLNEPFTVALTEAQAKKYFGVANPLQAMGKQITYKDSLRLSVVGIIRDVKEVTDLHFTDFISNATWQKSWLKNDFNEITDWGSINSSTQCFIKLSKGTPFEKVQSQMALLEKKHKESQKEPDSNSITLYKLQSLSDLHYNSDLGTFDNGLESANLKTIRMLAIVAFLLLLIAAINFINLETAQAVKRCKEVGLRKTMGGNQAGLIKIFLLESGLTATFSVMLALPMTQLAIIFFEEFLPKGVSLTLSNPATLVFLCAIIITVTFLSGLYPAFVLSSYQPAEALKNQLAKGRNAGTALLRKVLTVFQFSFSQTLIIGTLIVGWQIKFMVEKDMGFDRQAIINVHTPWWLSDNRPSGLKNELMRSKEVQNISQHDSAPALSGWSTSTLTYLDEDGEKPLTVHQRGGDTTYLSLYKIPLIAGRMVQPFDSVREYLVNEAFCRELGYEPIDIIGQSIKGNGGEKNYTIVGVMKDFHMQSLQKKIEPLSYRYHSNAQTLGIKLHASDNSLTQSIDNIKAIWTKIYPEVPFEYEFLDERVKKFYEAEKKISKLTNAATMVTIFISCLGLFGLAAYTAIQRGKEIGVRKVLGASVSSIVGLLSKEFLSLVAIAFTIAGPLAWYFGTQWLSGFAYKIDLSWEIFAIAASASLIIAFFTVGFKAASAAMTNPVESLKSE